MKCKICGNKTDWDSSYGREKFIVCPTCFNKILKSVNNCKKYKFSPESTTLEIILKIGRIKEGVD